VLSSAARFVNGLMTSAGERCESTWSGPFCASSSRTKIADSFQKRLFEMASTNLPRAVVLGHHRPRRRLAGAGAERVVVAEAHDVQVRQGAALFELAELLEPHVDAAVVGNVEVVGRILRMHTALEAWHRRLGG
jgi:hypothetical protein